jgi:putative transposase
VPKDTHRTATTDHAKLELPEQVTVAVELAEAAREGLLALAVGTGLQVLEAMLAEDVARWSVPRAATTRSGPRSVTAARGGQGVQVRRPRVRAADGTRELAVPTYQAFAATDLLTGLALERMAAKPSTRRYPVGWSRSAAESRPPRWDLQVRGLAPPPSMPWPSSSPRT